MLNDFLAALALLLILEGLMPFAMPNQWREALQTLTQQDNRFLRSMGLVAIIFGLILLTVVRA